MTCLRIACAQTFHYIGVDCSIGHLNIVMLFRMHTNITIQCIIYEFIYALHVLIKRKYNINIFCTFFYGHPLNSFAAAIGAVGFRSARERLLCIFFDFANTFVGIAQSVEDLIN